jgi:UDP-glucose 4-epimerase
MEVLGGTQVRALVTGGAGFMGSHLARELLDMGHEVLVVDDLSGGSVENLPRWMAREVFDITLTRPLRWAFDKFQPQLVYHLAAYAAEGLSPFIRRHNYMNNVIGSANVINECIKHDVEFLCFTSSMAVYGDQPAPFHEGAELLPIDPYGVAKMAVEFDLEIAHRQHGLQYVVFRPHNVYGPNQNIWDPYRNVIGIWMSQILEGKPLTIFGDGSQVREFTYIDDVTPHIASSYIGTYPSGRVYNLGVGTKVNIKLLAEMVSTIAGVHHAPVYLPPRHEVANSYPSTDLFAREYSPGQAVALSEGLMRMWEWAQAAPKQRSTLPDIEVRKGLYPQWEDV